MGKSVDRKQVDDYKLSLGRFRDVVKKNFDGIIVVSQRKTDDEFIKTVMEKEIPIENKNSANVKKNIDKI